MRRGGTQGVMMPPSSSASRINHRGHPAPSLGYHTSSELTETGFLACPSPPTLVRFSIHALYVNLSPPHTHFINQHPGTAGAWCYNKTRKRPPPPPPPVPLKYITVLCVRASVHMLKVPFQSIINGVGVLFAVCEHD